MSKIIGILAWLLWPAVALAQSYPSPVVQNLNLRGSLTNTGFTGANSALTLSGANPTPPLKLTNSITGT